ncbi:dTDP-4-dehydrorhamnose 3,5-epimerase [Prochlorococcus sp. AH-736-E15]|nr:dTDP-4-dehydrorhamnose 3,5-epimerase [Prochlorococcus sp. AH-736-E15]
MQIKFLKSQKGDRFKGPLILNPEKFFDSRGFFFESWNEKNFNDIISKKVTFVQDNHSFSFHGVLRGLHFQKEPYAQGKLIRVISGKILDIIVDLRSNSNTFKEWTSIVLSKRNKMQLWVPEGFAHGFITLTRTAEINYKTTQFWNKESERTIIWNDDNLNINWRLKYLKINSPIVSEKDLKGKTLEYLYHKGDLF